MHPSTFVTTIACLAGLAHGYANPGSCSGACNIHDPALIRRQSDGKYFRFSTGNKISYASSSSIKGPWTVLGSVLPRGSSINLPGKTDLWAPDISLVNGAYHLYYSVSAFGSQDSAIGLATSATMDPNSWTDHGSTGIRSSSSKPYNAIDANLFHDGGNYYMTFGSFWHDIYQAPMNSAATAVSSGPYNIAYNPSGTHAVEGAFMYKFGKYYYLFFSSGICCGYDTSRPAAGKEYKIRVCRSTSATGHFVDKHGVSCTNGGGTVVLESHGHVYGPGGQGVFTDPALGPVLYYHYVDTRIGYADGQKRFGWNKIDFSSGWPVV
ncbi:arabinan endo-1,5-alpha-L-arabinosidase [Aspergillus clavatus NRRL 1]|uniref:Probable arabinan endo-1,5-alpha-L-arabinosidase A n=1 Tax=Aspergillus clavatus (strain ATCC 1007 / CBS 513.65 / DSM 816 / NCTC 3887 / NRRL 1 / QM 1276 / 107) TaxID=344612 RepID=ABNA_ASPCL|nr:extracellular endo-1,5-alpha-L-arabinase, putative [Aspergillus clavatus NRRL 1]A1CLG4.1 RecName: Full=Probable arabinan endo-1,5-alpha-L-arabinosidase A; AltName: Full=Endo-1,5-alpha-L-arabinanase A; Short=ABN A; Flags: Precursor [Aspergillus clavatus NRRL 1]EAW09988.1 extracellular endo-1,5-alpha-L-arabinase, putative [Aspergillus clavatus NRRL 1]